MLPLAFLFLALEPGGVQPETLSRNASHSAICATSEHGSSQQSTSSRGKQTTDTHPKKGHHPRKRHHRGNRQAIYLVYRALFNSFLLILISF